MKRAIALTLVAAFALTATVAFAGKPVKTFNSLETAAEQYAPFKREKRKLVRQGFTVHKAETNYWAYFVQPTGDHVVATYVQRFSKRTGGDFSLETTWVELSVDVWWLAAEQGYAADNFQKQTMIAY